MVVFGGLGLSMLATLVIVPPLLSIALNSRFGGRLQKQSLCLKHLDWVPTQSVENYRT